MSTAIPHKNYIQRLYKQGLRTVFDHYALNRDIYRQHCLKLRSRFEANRNESNPVRIEALVRAAEEELAKTRHLKPFKYPTAPGGTKHMRNAVLPEWVSSKLIAIV
jgi:NADH dehydrogenase (ubiquinone) 1 beta subcomplex subunit 9